MVMLLRAKGVKANMANAAKSLLSKSLEREYKHRPRITNKAAGMNLASKRMPKPETELMMANCR